MPHKTGTRQAPAQDRRLPAVRRQLPQSVQLRSRRRPRQPKPTLTCLRVTFRTPHLPRSFLNYWEKKYKHIWEIEKDPYMRRYEKAQKSLSAFEADIAKYQQLKSEVRPRPEP